MFVVVIYKVIWLESQIVCGMLVDISDKVCDVGICKMVLILVGNFLGKEYYYLRFYVVDFSYEYCKV